MSKCKGGKEKPIYIVFEDTSYYPYVVVKTTIRDKAERAYAESDRDHSYLCIIVKEK